MLILIKGAGDIASGIALRLWHAGFSLVMTDLEKPTCIRRTVSFSQAIVDGETQVEDVKAIHVNSINEAEKLLRERKAIPVFADEQAECMKRLKPDIVVDAILAKKNLGTSMNDAGLVIGVGPGFTAGTDCHAVVETQRGHYLGRVITDGSAAENTGIPGNIGGYTVERIIRAPKAGKFVQNAEIGDEVRAGQIVAYVEAEQTYPVSCQIGGILRGILPTGTMVYEGMKSGDVDPRCRKEHCYHVSDKALSVGGGVLEACVGYLNREWRGEILDNLNSKR